MAEAAGADEGEDGGDTLDRTDGDDDDSEVAPKCVCLLFGSYFFAVDWPGIPRV